MIKQDYAVNGLGTTLLIKDKYAGNGLGTLSLFSMLLNWKDQPPPVKYPHSIHYPLRQTIQATSTQSTFDSKYTIDGVPSSRLVR